MNEIKIGSVVTTGAGFRLFNLRFQWGVVGLIVNIQGDIATILTLNGKHEWITTDLCKLKLTKSIINCRMGADEIKANEHRHLVTLHLDPRGYRITTESIKISVVHSNFKEVEYIKDAKSYNISLSPFAWMDCRCKIHCII